MRVQLNRQNGNRDLPLMYILGTLHFMRCCTCLYPIHWTWQFHNCTIHGSRNNPSTLARFSTLLLRIGQQTSFQFNSWLGSTGQDNSGLKLTDNPVVDVFTIVTDHNTSNITQSAHLVQTPKTLPLINNRLQKVVLPQTKMAVSKEGTLTLGSKHPLIIPVHDNVPLASQAATITNQSRDLTPITPTTTISKPLTVQSVMHYFLFRQVSANNYFTFSRTMVYTTST